MRVSSLAFAVVVATAWITASGAAVAQTFETLEFRRADWTPQTPAAIGFSDAVDGSRQAVIVARSPVDRPLDGGGTFRGFVIRAEIRCEERRWRIVDMTQYDRDYRRVGGMGDAPWAPLIRETPLHASLTDVCDGGHSGPVGITSNDHLAVQKWLDGS